MYHFVKIVNKKDKKGIWYLKPNSVEQVKEHFNKVFGREISAGIHDKISQENKHPDTAWRSAVDMICSVKGYGWDCHGLPWLMEATKLENEVINGRIRDFEKGLDFYLPNGVQEFIPIWDMYEISDEQYKDELEYPIEELFHFEDVRYMKWDMPGLEIKGTHWYAKIGNKDIRDKKGNMKWDTKEEAEEAARWFCQELNYKRYHNYD